MSRPAAIVFAVILAAAAPARAWCEASCLASAHSTQNAATPHCPAHEPAGNAASLSTNDRVDCPSIGSARPIPVTIVVAPGDAVERTVVLPAPRTAAPRHQGVPQLKPPGTFLTPLRV